VIQFQIIALNPENGLLVVTHTANLRTELEAILPREAEICAHVGLLPPRIEEVDIP
jgi:hypothetical protein